MKTWFDPSLTYEDLAKRLVDHLTRQHSRQRAKNGPVKISRLYFKVVNHMSKKTRGMLVAHIRHEMTDYEEVLRSLPPAERETARRSMHQSYNAAIISAYPFLRPLTEEEIRAGRCSRHGGGNCIVAIRAGLLYTDTLRS